METRICWKCGQEKKLEEFHRNRTKLLGRDYVCKPCKREQDRKLKSTPKYLEKAKRYQQSERGKELRRFRQRRDYWVNRHKYTAKRMIEALVASGDLERMPCEKCGNPNSVGHHPDYAKPTEVTWLCQQHHSEVHRKDKTLSLSG